MGGMSIDDCTVKSIDWRKWDEVIEKFSRLEHRVCYGGKSAPV